MIEEAPYQTEGADFLASRSRALLLDEMGVGKTLQAVMAAAIVERAHVRVICPAIAVPVWERNFRDEALRFSKTPKLEVMSYERAVSQKVASSPDVFICDEAHFIKTVSAKRSAFVQANARNAQFAWGLTGTPMPNNQGELYNLLRVFAPLSLEAGDNWPAIRSELAFWQRYAHVRETDWGPKPTGKKNVAELRQRIAPFILRRRLADVVKDLPPIRWDRIDLKVSRSAQRDAEYERRLQDALDRGEDALGMDDPQIVTMRRINEVEKAHALAPILAEELEGSGPEHKVVVFGWFTEALDVISTQLAKYGVVGVYGGVSAARKAEAEQKFQNESARVFVGQIIAAGTAITLTASNDLVFLGQDWVPANNAQAAMRVYRRGQKRGVRIRSTNLVGSVDDVVQGTLMRKTRDLLAFWENDNDEV